MGGDSLAKPLQRGVPAHLQQNRQCWWPEGSGVSGINSITLGVQEKISRVYLLRRMKNSFPRFIYILLVYGYLGEFGLRMYPSPCPPSPQPGC